MPPNQVQFGGRGGGNGRPEQPAGRRGLGVVGVGRPGEALGGVGRITPVELNRTAPSPGPVAAPADRPAQIGAVAADEEEGLGGRVAPPAAAEVPPALRRPPRGVPERIRAPVDGGAGSLLGGRGRGRGRGRDEEDAPAPAEGDHAAPDRMRAPRGRACLGVVAPGCPA